MNTNLLSFVSAIPVAATCVAHAASPAASPAGRGERPSAKPLNVIYIMCDDHSLQTISAYGHALNSTPNIDRLAREGMRFDRAYVANSLSGPSRACLFTGKHSHANGFKDHSCTFDGSQPTFPKLLQKNGYETAIVGKWHLVSEPTGFDHWDILNGQGDYYNPLFFRNGQKLRRQGYATNIITDLAINWLDSIHDRSKPFCLFVHHKAPHRTWMPDTCDLDLYKDVEFPLPATFYDDYATRRAAALQEMSIDRDMDLVYDLKMADPENEIHSNPDLEPYGRRLYTTLPADVQRAWDRHYAPVIKRFKAAGLSGRALAEWKYQQYMRDYLRVIHAIDRNVGRLLDYLDRNGLTDNTMIVYTSDQGFYMGEHGWFDKRFMYEESYRTPLLVRLPGGKRGATSRLVQNIDFGPTILDLAGISTPADMHGESFLPVLKGSDRKWRKALYYHFYEFPAEHAVRRHYGVSTDRYKLIHFYNDIDEWELFDLKKDPHELNNIYGTPGTEKITRQLMQELKRLQEQYDDPIRFQYPVKM